MTRPARQHEAQAGGAERYAKEGGWESKFWWSMTNRI